MNSSKGKSQAESTDLGHKLEEAESQLNLLTKAKQALTKSLEEAKAALEEETRVRTKIQGESRNLQASIFHSFFSDEIYMSSKISKRKGSFYQSMQLAQFGKG